MRGKITKSEKERDPWCGRCVYRAGIPGHGGPCVREGRDRRYCFIRLLIWEAWHPDWKNK